MPLCTGPSSARRRSVPPARPRSEQVSPGTPTRQLPASASTSTSAASSSACWARNDVEVRRADLLLALDEHGDVARWRPRVEPAPQHRGVRHRPRLVVGAAAPEEAAVALHRLEGIARPALAEPRRLHVVVGVEQHRRHVRGVVPLADDRRGTPGRGRLAHVLEADASSSAAVVSALCCTSPAVRPRR